MNSQNPKSHQRQLARARIAELSPEYRKSADATICTKLTQLPAYQSAQTIASYQPLPDEVDLTQFHQFALSAGKTLAFPVTSNNSMQFFAPKGSLIKNLFQIPEPNPKTSQLIHPDQIDLIILPCRAFDPATKHRLGRGAGYYDRFLSASKNSKTHLIIVAYHTQSTPNLPHDPHDVPAHQVITELPL